MTSVERGAKTGAKTSAKTAKPAVKQRCGGIFAPDPTTPGDPITGRQVCRCGLLGEPGDAHHTLPSAPPEQEEHRRRIGEQT